MSDDQSKSEDGDLQPTNRDSVINKKFKLDSMVFNWSPLMSGPVSFHIVRNSLVFCVALFKEGMKGTRSCPFVSALAD